MSIYCKLHITQLSNEYKVTILDEFIRISCSPLFGYTSEIHEDIRNIISYDKVLEDISILQGKLTINNYVGDYISTSILKNANVLHGKCGMLEGWMHKGTVYDSDAYWSVREIFEDKDNLPYDDLGKRKTIVAKLCFNYIDEILKNPIIAYCMPYNPQF